MTRRPEETPAQALQIHDVPDQIQRIAPYAPQEIQEQLDTALARPEVHVGDPNRSMPFDMAHALYLETNVCARA
jgi:hypothetical protein